MCKGRVIWVCVTFLGGFGQVPPFLCASAHHLNYILPLYILFSSKQDGFASLYYSPQPINIRSHGTVLIKLVNKQ